MPPALPAIIGAALSGITYSAATGFAFGTFSAFLARAALGIVLGFVSQALAPKPGKSSFTAEAQGITQSVREPVASHKLIYGQTRVGGTMAYIGGTDNNKYLHLVIMLSANELTSIDEVWLQDSSIPNDYLDADGNVTAGRFKNRCRVRKYLGTPDQTADEKMVAEIPEWTVDHRLQGIGYVAVRLQFDQEVYPGGMPNVTAFVKGRKIFDPRDGVQRFTTNGVLFQHDYISDAKYGFNDRQNINEDVARAGANICDEFVDLAPLAFPASAVTAATDIITLTGDMLQLHLGDRVEATTTGTLPTGISPTTDYYIIPYQFKDTPRVKLATTFENALAGINIDITTAGTGVLTLTRDGEPRYHGGGVVDTSNPLDDNMNKMLTLTGGRAYWVGGQWWIKPAAWEAPTIYLDENDIIDTITVKTAISWRDTFNAVKGVYRSIDNLDNPADWPALTSNTFADEDGEVIFKDMDTPFTQRPQTSRRVAKIELIRSRREKTMRLICNLRMLRVQCGSTMYISLAKYGFENKIFEVTNFSLTPTGSEQNPSVGVLLDLRESEETDYDWTTSEEKPVSTATSINLPNPFTVVAPTGVSFDSTPQTTRDGDVVYVAKLRWSEHPDQFVLSGGSFRIEYKPSASPSWQPFPPVPGSNTEAEIFTASLGAQYDVRIYAVNNVGVPSSPVTLLNLAAGSGGGVGSTEDWGNFGAGPGSSEDWGDFSGVPTLFDDWGAFV